MPIVFYGYDKCDTCRKARSLLQKRGTAFSLVNITISPPPVALLKKILSSGGYSLKDLFNKSGEMYRSLNMKDKFTTLSESELLDLLAKNGKLVKRPIVTDGTRHTVGFNEEAFKKTWS